MKRTAWMLLTAAVAFLVAAPSAAGQSTVSVRATGCQASAGGVSTLLTGSITPVPGTDFDISVVSSVQGEVFHISLPAGFDITGASVFVGPAPLGRLTATVFRDLDLDDVRDPEEPVIGSASLTSHCHPGPTRAEQCSNENWRTFGIFASQGDCVAFVTTGGANEPGQNEPGPPGRGDSTPDSVSGSGTSSFCSGTFEVNAESGPNGENPTGQVTCGSFFSGPVTCLNVTGNVALLNIASNFGALALRITDLGTTGDRVEALPAGGCELQTSYIDLGFSGDITVID